MRAERLLSLVAILQLRRQCTAAELAAELGVSVRTIHRDLEVLGAAGFPVTTERGRGGGCALLATDSRRLAAISGDEADALGLAGLPGPAAELGFGALLAAGQLKLLAALPARVRESALRAGQRFHLDAGDWFREEIPHPTLGDVARALWADHALAIRYRRGDGREVDREVAPIGLVLKSGLWYLVADVERQHRVYRVSRIICVRVLDARIERPNAFDLAVFWDEWARSFEQGLAEYPAVLRISPAGRGLLHRIADALRRAPAEPAPSLDPDGWERRRVCFEKLEFATSAVLGLGPEVEVVEPAELRIAVSRAAREIAELYTGS